MDMLENKGTQKRRMPKAGKLILAAALAVGCVLSIAAGLPSQVYNFFSGGSITVMSAGGETIGGAEIVMAENNEPIVLEDGKLWFVNGEERTDLTGLIDEDTPYIYEHTDPTTGNKGYVILGGTVDDFGWAELVDLGNGGGTMGSNFSECFLTLDGKTIRSTELTPEQREQINQMDSVPTTYTYRPWFQSALDQLGIENL